MSNLTEYIKRQRSAGLTDYQILKNAGRYHRNERVISHSKQTGGNFVPDENVPGLYREYDANGPTNVFYDSQDKVFYGQDEQGQYPIDSSAITVDRTIGIDDRDLPQELQQVIANLDQPKSVENITGESFKYYPPSQEVSTMSADPFVGVSAGTILYYPSSDVQTISKETPIFVKLPEVLDMSKQRTFTLFFTPNIEYARRFAGIQSLNKRDVYVHKLQVIEDIPNLKRIDGNMISNDIDNINLGHNFCGPSVDGEINGIQIVYETASGGAIEEYYICNPERYMKIVSTEMQVDATSWVNITDNREKMYVEPVQSGEVDTYEIGQPRYDDPYQEEMRESYADERIGLAGNEDAGY